MNTHEEENLRWQLRGMRREVEPQADLWPGIAARIAATPQQSAAADRPRARGFAPWAMAASVLLAVGVVWQMMPSTTQQAPAGNPVIRQQAVAMALDYERAFARMQQGDVHPEMHGAIGELDRGAAQILTAIDRDPDAAFLLEQLRRTYARRLQLTQRAVMT
ncbi:MAG: anti-sigma factor [Pseudoxanthomonas sp.]